MSREEDLYYNMDRSRLGLAVILNNLDKEQEPRQEGEEGGHHHDDTRGLLFMSCDIVMAVTVSQRTRAGCHHMVSSLLCICNIVSGPGNSAPSPLITF